MKLHNAMFEKMRMGTPVVGCKLLSRSTSVAECMGYCGMDYVFIDGEHFVYDFEHIEDLIRAVELSGATPIMRLPSLEQSQLVRALMAGIQGVVLPHIETYEQVRTAVDEIKFPPLGKRGFGPTARSGRYGFISPNGEYMRQANENTMAIGMVESVKGIENLDALLETGLDVIRIGGGDLSIDMGYEGKITSEVEEAIEGICAKVKASPKVILGDSGLGGLKSQADFEKAIARGCHMFDAGSDIAILRAKLTQTAESFREYLNAHTAKH
ncbi:2,4-dihydroxyhept-2-ene-1,7-dioic acid aldolase [Synergistales bacterium]|nr:2,4-dihydroxyhept-2-ene-1,7-dioic acid aldolase [Synergistales bacterium]